MEKPCVNKYTLWSIKPLYTPSGLPISRQTLLAYSKKICVVWLVKLLSTETVETPKNNHNLNAIFAAEFSVENPMIPISHIVGTSQIDWNENPKTEATMGSTSPISFAHYFQFV